MLHQFAYILIFQNQCMQTSLYLFYTCYDTKLPTTTLRCLLIIFVQFALQLFSCDGSINNPVVSSTVMIVLSWHHLMSYSLLVGNEGPSLYYSFYCFYYYRSGDSIYLALIRAVHCKHSISQRKYTTPSEKFSTQPNIYFAILCTNLPSSYQISRLIIIISIASPFARPSSPPF